jgi:hypothetical protein
MCSSKVPGESSRCGAFPERDAPPKTAKRPDTHLPDRL